MDINEKKAATEAATSNNSQTRIINLSTTNIVNNCENQEVTRNIYKIVVGKSCNSNTWTEKALYWHELVTKLSTPLRTNETVIQYKSMNKNAQGVAKDHGGFVGGTLSENGPRKAEKMKARSLVTLDIDDADESTIEVIEDMFAGNAWALYSTHSHTPERPRLRLIIPLNHEVTPQEYGPIARRAASYIDINAVDEASFRVNQLMYWPSCPKDGEFIFRTGEGKPLDADEILNMYHDWTDCSEWPVSKKVKDKIRLTTGKPAEDPTTKKGLIGDFCRAYTITEAISAFLPGVYEPTEQTDRFTFAEGSTAGGMLVFANKWAYSYHATDPACEKLCNAFDLVRIHKFGALDEDAEPETPVSKLPSFVEMEKFARRLEPVAAETSRRNFMEAGDDFANIVNGMSSESGTDEEHADENTASEDWQGKLTWRQRKGKDDQLENSPREYATVLLNHPTYKGKLAFDIFSNKRVKTDAIPEHPDTRDWDEVDDVAAVIQFFAAPPFWAIGKNNIKDAIDYVFTKVPRVHPVQQWLEGLPAWDGVERLDTLFVDYLGADDTALNRAMTRKHIFAAIRRVYQPGWKHDQVLALDGPQGIGKSTLIHTLFGDEWFDDTSLDISNAKERTLQLAGKWALELGELTDYKKSSVEAYKAFLSGQTDNIRGLYEKNYKPVPRQFVVFATTNVSKFLKGDTGNRRWWVIICHGHGVKSPFSEQMAEERQQIWAEAFAKYKTDENTCYLGDLEQDANKMQSGLNENADDVRIDELRTYMKAEVPFDWETMPRGERYEWHRFKRVHGVSYSGELMPRPAVCYAEVLDECFPSMKKDQFSKNTLRELFKYAGMEYAGNTGEGSTYGKQRRYKLKE